MLMVTTDSIVGKEIVEVKGLVKGSTVRSKHIGKDIGASLKTIVGGELNGYNEMCRPDDTITRGEMANALANITIASCFVMVCFGCIRAFDCNNIPAFAAFNIGSV